MIRGQNSRCDSSLPIRSAYAEVHTSAAYLYLADYLQRPKALSARPRGQAVRRPANAAWGSVSKHQS